MKKPILHPDVNKAAMYAIVVNAIQIAALIVFVLYVVLGKNHNQKILSVIVVVAACMAIYGASIDIQEALRTRRRERTISQLQTANDQMDALNLKLRAQRHDFLNHLQVVYSLIEMEEYAEANDYIEQVYGKITSVSRVMKTANPAVNALLQVKVAACEKAGVQVDVTITSKWETLESTLPDWEMCKVLSNLIDNAVDAMEAVPEGKRRLSITLGENVKQYTFRVENTGEMIPENIREHLFIPGFTTKGDGHGMGLHIVRRTLRDRGGDIGVRSDENTTVFSGFVPKHNAKGG